MTLDIVFMGTPQFSVPTLAALIDAGHRVTAVYTQPPRPAGRRGLAETPSPVHTFAAGKGIPVFNPLNFKSDEAVRTFAAQAGDIAVVVAYGLILPRTVLSAPRLGCINLHGSLLPRWRGAAPIQRAVMAGDAETGVMTMQMDAGLDTGPVLATRRTPIGEDETSGELHDRLSTLGAGLVVETLAEIEAGRNHAIPQPEAGITYAAKIDKAEAEIDFSRPARAVHNHIRGLAPAPGAWFEVTVDGKAERVKVLGSRLLAAADGPDRALPAGRAPGTVIDDALSIACGEGAVRLVTVQRAGRKAQSSEEFLRGFPIGPGQRIGRG
ncbi:MAG: methionyl-tRNA formyltransferase [Hyphomicrobiaceae bacterium]|nr:methionyl-tRNA formyltransferase [Hyphomicrobiaceae bacterium]